MNSRSNIQVVSSTAQLMGLMALVLTILAMLGTSHANTSMAASYSSAPVAAVPALNR